MTHRISRRTFAASSFSATLPVALPAMPVIASPEPNRRILIVVGPSKHPPGTHEVAATGRLVQHCIQQIGLPDLKADLRFEWPNDPTVLDQTLSVIFIGDFFPPMRLEGTEKIMSDLSKMEARRYADNDDEQHRLVGEARSPRERHPHRASRSGAIQP
ncbi:MAG: hypothetical protein SGI77_11040 [Pirellulaceae bacterium]|nr:hypothetical protein [Pirellulaceae bacterium]